MQKTAFVLEPIEFAGLDDAAALARELPGPVSIQMPDDLELWPIHSLAPRGRRRHMVAAP